MDRQVRHGISDNPCVPRSSVADAEAGGPVVDGVGSVRDPLGSNTQLPGQGVFTCQGYAQGVETGYADEVDLVEENILAIPGEPHSDVQKYQLSTLHAVAANRFQFER